MATAQQQAEAAASAAYKSIVQGWGIPITPEVKTFINRAVKNGWSSAQFVQNARRMKFYAQKFPGIRRANGALKMTEAQYLSGYQQARDYAASVGRPFSPAAYGLAIKNNNSPSEIRAKIEALDIIKTQRDVLDEFNQYLVARGVINKPLDEKDLRKFVMRQGPAEWEREWKTAYTASQVQRAGIEVGKPGEGNDIGFKSLQQLVKQAGPNFDPATLDWQRLAELARDVIPLSQWQGRGISKKDLVAEAVGAKKASIVAGEIKRVMAEHLAAQEDTAANSFTGGPRGAQLDQGRPQVQSTE